MAAHFGTVADEDARASPSADVPQADGAIGGPRRNVLAVGVPPDHIHVRCVSCDTGNPMTHQTRRTDCALVIAEAKQGRQALARGPKQM